MKKLFYNASILVIVALMVTIVINSCKEDSDLTDPLLTEEAFPYSFGCLQTPANVYADIPVVKTGFLKTLPISVSLTVPPVGDQGYEGSCVAWGTTYAGRSTSYQNTHGGVYSTSTNIFSPEYVYNQIKVTSDCGSGAYVTTGLNLLVNQGVCVWADMPYTDVSCSTYPNSTQIAHAANYKIASYATVPINSTSIKEQLAAGKIVIVAGPIYKTFMYLGDGQIMTSAKGRNYGGHCYACVGYDDNLGAFKIMNSWGTSWASSGFGWISYSVINKIWQEAYIVYEP